ncbi:MAG: hypothetical protein N2558_04385 [Patescibacteria group bacterium]|nr:hypothetical protein [Patescibacteria group bacterium]
MKKFFLIFYSGVFVVIFVVGVIFYFYSRESSPVVAVVGEEKIYLKDLEYELSLHPNRNDPNVKELILDELIKDSIILQAGNKEGKIFLSPAFYNSDNKNYEFRFQKINQVKSLVQEELDFVSGTIVTIWFFNNDRAGRFGYEGGKNSAYKKIKSLRDRVSNGEITIDEAVMEVKSDTTLFDLDFAYQTNAKIDFNITKGQRVTFDEEFDKLIWTVEEGDVSDIYPLRENSFVLGGLKEVAYAFFYVKARKISNNENTNFEDWLENYKKDIPVIKYQ